MRRIMMKSKIHRARVTAADLDYEGPITLDSLLMKWRSAPPRPRPWLRSPTEGPDDRAIARVALNRI